jgi:hypothetical protein
MRKYQYDNKGLPFGHSKAINDNDVLAVLNNCKFNFADILSDNVINNQFCFEYVNWIKSSSLNTLVGIDEYKYAVFSQGTSESFDKFYLKNSKRRFRCFHGEYLYHKLAWRNSYDWCYIEDAELDANDAVIISVPFADTGCKHLETDKILSRCTELGIPVLIDCAYYSISSNIIVDLTHPCITDVTFSLSKVFPVAHARIGVRLTRDDCDDLLFVYDKAEYTNRVSAALGLELIRTFPADYIVNKYKTIQETYCKYLDICPSDTVLFGIAAQGKYTEYNRGCDTNRLGLHNFLNKDLATLKGAIYGSTE